MFDAPPLIDPVAGQPIIVTARALPDPAADRAYSVEQIGSDRLQDSPSTKLEDILRQVAGLQLFRRSDARSANPVVSIRWRRASRWGTVSSTAEPSKMIANSSPP